MDKTQEIKFRQATESERLNIDPEESLPEGIEVVDFGEEPAFCCLPGDYVVTLENVSGRSGTYLLQASKGSGFIKRI